MHTRPTKSSVDTHTLVTPSTEKFAFNNELNAEFLEKSYGHNLGFAKKMFAIFLGTIEEDMKELTKFLVANDYKGLHDVAHKTKNNFTWVGLPVLSKTMYNLEAAATAQSVSVVAHYDELMEMYGPALELVKNESARIINYLSYNK